MSLQTLSTCSYLSWFISAPNKMFSWTLEEKIQGSWGEYARGPCTWISPLHTGISPRTAIKSEDCKCSLLFSPMFTFNHACGTSGAAQFPTLANLQGGFRLRLQSLDDSVGAVYTWLDANVFRLWQCKLGTNITSFIDYNVCCHYFTISYNSAWEQQIKVISVSCRALPVALKLMA